MCMYSKYWIYWSFSKSLNHFVWCRFLRWSYGILLYEIVTMGCNPYPTVQVDCLIDYLKAGHRMLKPFNCSQELYVRESNPYSEYWICCNCYMNGFSIFFRSYDLMLTCWHCEPEKRPTFSEISHAVDQFIQHPELNGISIMVDLKPHGGWISILF